MYGLHKSSIINLCLTLVIVTISQAQISKLTDFTNYNSPTIGVYQGITFREAGFSGLYPIPNTNGREFWTCSDRGVNIDAANANSSACRPTYDKIYAFPSYAPKIHRIRIIGNSVQVLQTITIKRPNNTPASGLINPTGLGSTLSELASTDTVMDCANFLGKTIAKDTFGIDSEGLIVDKSGNFWICEEGGPTIWKVNRNGVLIARYTPYANLPGVQSVYIQIDSVFKYRKNNRGFEGIAIAPNGKIYAIIQSPILYPSRTVGEASRIHRILEIDPATNAQRMFVYLNDGIIGASGSNQIRLRDWKIGDMAAVNDTTFLVLEAAIRGTSDIRRLYRISLNGASVVHSGLYNGLTLEALVDSVGLTANGIVPVRKTLVMDLLANGWPSQLDKAEGLAIMNDSTIAIGNDNDYGQISPLENGIATATGNESHVITFRLSGVNKLQHFLPVIYGLNEGITGVSTEKTPYMTPIIPSAKFTSLMTVGDSISTYKMSGLMDGMGAYDNNNGTFTLLINHEISNSLGKVRAHGNTGAYVSKWVINKSDLQVVSGSDLISKVNLWNGSGYTTYTSSSPMPVGFSRFCSADLPMPSAFYNTATGLGTQERIYLNGEESGAEGRAFAHIVTGANAGTTYELPYLGKFSWENAVASPTMSNKTIVAGLDDGTGGQVYFYIGTKTSVGTEIDKAGLSNGKLFGVSVTGLATEISASVPTPNTNFGLVDLGTVQNMTGATLNTNSVNAAVTTFLRPEDGAWDPSNPRDFYFVTTNAFGSPSKMWRLRFNNIATPETGGTITAVLDGTEGQQMLDNLTIDNYGHILLQEDPGNNVHIAKMWEYTIATDKLKLVAQHDTTRFIQGGANYLTQDEESSGIIDVQSILGPGMFLVAQQSHYSIPGELVEGGQLLTFFNPETFNKSEEISVRGNNFDIVNGDNTPDVSDNTDFGVTRVGAILRKNFTLTNTGPVSLTVSGVSFTGIGSTDFEIAGVQFPIIIAPFSNRIVPIDFRPLTEGNRRINVVITNSDYNEGQFTFTIQANALSSKMSVKGNNRIIQNGDVTPSAENNTDFGNVKINTKVTKTFNVVNDGQSSLTISKVSISGSGSSRFTSLTSVPLVVAPNSSATISIQFQPVAEEKSVANVQIQHDVAFNSSYTFAIAGAGFTTKPDIILFGNGQEITQRDSTPSPTDLTDFGITFIGEKNNHEFSIKNTGSENLDITSIGIQGIDANEFTVLGVPSFPVSISVGSMSNFTIRFEPKSQGIKKSVLTIKSNVSSKEYNVMLQGNAQISTDVIGESSESFFDIYPNPSSEECTVSIQLLQEANVNVSLFNSQGSEVFISGNQQLQSGNHYIPVKLDTLSAGMYVIRLTINNKTFSKRLILQH